MGDVQVAYTLIQIRALKIFGHEEQVHIQGKRLLEAECLLKSHDVQKVERWDWGLGSALIQGRAPYNFPTYRMGAYFEVGIYSNVYGIQ